MIDAKETLNQLTQSNNGTNRLSAMIGAKQFIKDDESVSFRFMRGAKNKANYIIITLNAMDTYDVKFVKIGNRSKFKPPLHTVVNETKGLYNDMLKSHFEESTGLCIKL